MKRKVHRLLGLGLAMTLSFSNVVCAQAASPKELVDTEYYATRYEDLRAAFGNNEKALYNHYITFGMKEGRSASKWFDAKKYREKYADLDKAFGDNWSAYLEHYLRYGIKEGRSSCAEYDAYVYANNNPDLKTAFGYDFTKLKEHYQIYGESEGRSAKASTEVVYEDNSADDSREDVNEGYEIVECLDSTLFSHAILKYDYRGNLYERCVYDISGEVSSYQRYYFDESNREVKYELYNSEGLSLVCYYFYDEQGSLVKEEYYNAVGDLDEWTEYVYNEQERLLYENTYESDGKLTISCEYYYDQCGNEIVYDRYFVDEDSSNRFEYKYDENGVKRETKLYYVSSLGKKSVIYTCVYNEHGDIIGYFGASQSGTVENVEFMYTWEYTSDGQKVATRHDSIGRKICVMTYNKNGILIAITRYDGDGNIVE